MCNNEVLDLSEPLSRYLGDETKAGAIARAIVDGVENSSWKVDYDGDPGSDVCSCHVVLQIAEALRTAELFEGRI